MAHRTCPQCLTAFEIRRPNQFYCSKSCADKVGRERRRRDPARPSCAVDGCERPYVANDYCHNHWRMWRKYGDPTFRQRRVAVPKVAGAVCPVDGCGRKIHQQGMCSGHYRRMHEGRPLDAPMRKMAPKGSGYVNGDGYRKFTVNGRDVAEHRMVMERELGRPLEPFENIHHRNGVRDDNRLENLELWVTMQPTGQRPEDLVQWVVDHYPQLVREALQKETAHG